MLIGTVEKSSQGSMVDLVVASEKKSEEGVELFSPTPEPLKVFAQLLDGKELTSLIWSYLTPKEVGGVFLVSKLWKKATSSNPLWATFHKRVFSSENKVPLPSMLMVEESNLSEICKERYLETNLLFLNKMGVEFYSKYLGDVKAPPIPVAFIKRAKEVDPFDPEGRLVKDTHRLVYVPKEITITVPAGSNLTLNAKNRLIEDLNVTSQEERIVIVPVTINNLSMMITKCLKKGHVTGIHEDSWKNLLEEQGDKLVEEAYWSYQRKDVVGEGDSYKAQTILARANGYEVSSLRDRVVLNMLTYVESGAFVDRLNVARTSTPVVLGGRVYQVGSGAPDPQAGSGAPGPRLGLCYYSLDYRRVGVALGVLSGSSETLDTCN